MLLLRTISTFLRGLPSSVLTSPGVQVSGAMLAWLRTFDMERHLLVELIELRQRITAVIGNGLFSG